MRIEIDGSRRARWSKDFVYNVATYQKNLIDMGEQKKTTYEFLVLVFLKHLFLVGNPTRNTLLKHREKMDYFRFVGLGDSAADRTKDGECAGFLFG